MFPYILLAVICFAELVYLEPRRKEMADNAAFDNRVLGFIDGLFLDEFHGHCCAADIRSHARYWLSKIRSDKNARLECISPGGFRYTAFAHGSDHALFAVLCIADYAKTHCDDSLLEWASSMLVSANHMTYNRF